MSIKKKINLLNLNIKLNGGALYIAIMISIVIGIILSLFILISRYNQRTITSFAQSSQLNYNLKSAFEIAGSDYFLEENNNSWFRNSINDDSIKIKKISWGAYLVLVMNTKSRHQKLTLSGIYGTFMDAETGLVVPDNFRPIGLSGKIILRANCYFPKAGVKPAYIEGQSYISDPANAAFIKTASSQIPELNESFKKAITLQQNGLNVYSDSLSKTNPSKADIRFSGKTLLLEHGSATLNNLELSNNIKIVGEDLIIDNTCRLNNILIVCNKVRFKEGFIGSVHVIASDSIIIDKKCEFIYPSSFVLSVKKNNSNSLNCIQFDEECKFFGGIVAFNNYAGLNDGKVLIKLNGKSEISGLVFSENYLHIEGKIFGNLFCNTLLLKTFSAVYENHILGCEINPKKFAHILSIPDIFKKNGKLFCCKKF